MGPSVLYTSTDGVHYIKAARERKKLKLAPASGADRTNHEEHSNKIVGAKKSSLEKSMPMLV